MSCWCEPCLLIQPHFPISSGPCLNSVTNTDQDESYLKNETNCTLFTNCIYSKHPWDICNLILAKSNREGRVSSLIVSTLQTDKLRLGKFT